VSAGDGVVDNWSGASLLPSLYEAVKIEPRNHAYVFIGFTDEERGDVGSRFYARQMTKEQVAATDAMVNMDTLGLAPTEIWASHSDERLNGALIYIGKQTNIPVTGANVEQVGSTDSEQFAARKIPSITIHSLTQETWNAHILHTSKDRFSAIRLDDYYQTYRLLAAYQPSWTRWRVFRCRRPLIRRQNVRIRTQLRRGVPVRSRAYRVAPTVRAGIGLEPGRSHQISPPPITSPIAINCVPVMTPPNTEPRPGSSRRYSRKKRAVP
jgi:hypothetical protein